MKRIYKTAWFLLTLSVIATVATGSFNALSLLVYGLAVLALVYALALWSVLVDTRDPEPETLQKI